MAFYNVVDSIKAQDFTNLSSNAFHIGISKCGYSILHILCYYGKFPDLEAFLNRSTFDLKCDIFGRSPFFYGIIESNQNCIDALIKYMNSFLQDKNSYKFGISLYAIRNDFLLIIKNSSLYLHILLKNIMVSSDILFAKIPRSLPTYHIFETSIPDLKDFVLQGQQGTIEENPYIFTRSAFPFMCAPGSYRNYQILQFLIECSNDQIYTTQMIQFLIELQWTSHRFWIAFFTFLYFVNIILFLLLISYNFDSIPSLIVFIVVNSFLFLWEIIQLYITGFLDYFSNILNQLDTLRTIFTAV